MFEFAWLLLALPAAGALINLFFGHRLSKNAIGAIASGVVIAAFAVSVALLIALLGLPAEERSVTVPLWEWITIGTLELNAALLIDPLSVTMILVVTGVGALIHLYAVSYMHDDERFQRFFVYLNFFIFAMLILVLSDSFVGMFVGWEGVGLASYLLIGFWFDVKDSTYGWYADAGKKAFLVNRIGDFGMLVAMMALWGALGTLTFHDVFEQAEAGMLAGGVATLVCLMLLLGATGKSAQIPLFVWLPDAMAGPTPVSALIHAATMVTAGIYMIARTHSLWYLAPAAAETAAWIGVITAFIAATIALVQNDIKKVLAYSTISQLGYMMMGVGVGAYGASIFHLTTHAFFKALLFLAAGSVMHGLHGETDMRKMGGLRSKMPSTYRTMFIGAMVLAGIPLLSGFFSKDAILVFALEDNILLYSLGLITALLTAFYAFRMIFLTFSGEPRDKKLVEHAHESPRLMTWPLWILAGLSILGGLINLPFIFTLDNFLKPSVGEHAEPTLVLELVALTLSSVIALLGFWMARGKYVMHEGWVDRATGWLGFMKPVLEHKWYFDEVYNFAIVNPLKALASWFAGFFDPKVIDGAVNGVASGTGWLSERTRRLQNGYVPTYALSILVGVVAVILYFLVV
jgi:NADH-quinone oxidoreductase subunit L